MPRKQLVEAEADWLPLSRAAFAFQIGENGECVPADDGSFQELARVLKENTGAHEASVNPKTSSFSFIFFEGSVERLCFGPPWALLQDPVDPDPKIDAEPVFGGNGLIIVSDEEASQSKKRYKSIRQATGLVWRQYILRYFDRAVSKGAVVLYARTPTLSAPFERLPADVWPLLDVVDWPNGLAVAPDGTAYWSIHAKPLPLAETSPEALRQGSRAVIEEAITAAYDEAEENNKKPPNIKELPDVVQTRLKAQGYSASGKHIMEIGRAEKYACRRRPPGRTVLSERKTLSE